MNDYFDDTDDETNDSDVIDCPECGESIYEDSEQCPYCGDYISTSQSPRFTNPTVSKLAKTVVWILIGLLVLPAILAALNLL